MQILLSLVNYFSMNVQPCFNYISLPSLVWEYTFCIGLLFKGPSTNQRLYKVYTCIKWVLHNNLKYSMYQLWTNHKLSSLFYVSFLSKRSQKWRYKKCDIPKKKKSVQIRRWNYRRTNRKIYSACNLTFPPCLLLGLKYWKYI